MIVLNSEVMTRIWDEIRPLVKAYWDEAESYRHYQELNMSWERYHEYEQAGMLHCVTARDDGVLVGYAVGYISDSMRTQAKTWGDDMFYVVPEYRGRHVGTGLMRYIEQVCQKIGVVEIFLHTRSHSDVPAMAKHLDYEEVSVQYSKRLSRADSAYPSLAVMETISDGQRLQSQTPQAS